MSAPDPAAARPGLDPATRAQAEAARPDQSVWVSANAGSGKTRVLTNRVARLLLAGAAPSRILCLTYTKAAAAEMQNRLFKTLGSWAMADDAELERAVHGLLAEDEPSLDALRRAEARRLFARALETPGGLKIQTIHAFCESVLSRFPLEAGVSPHFQVIDEAAAEELLTEARDDAMRARGEDPILSAAVERLLAVLPETTFDEALSALARDRRRFEGADPAYADMLADALSVPRGAEPAQLLADWAARLDRDLMKRLGRAFAESDKKSNVGYAAAFREASEASDPRAAFDAICAALLKKDGGLRLSGFPTKDVEDANPWLLPAIARLQAEIPALLARTRGADRLQTSAALTSFARAALARYAELKAARAGLDYEDLIERAVALLTRADARDWVRFKLDGGVEHILVDEAQDTSDPQWRAVEALAEEFFAGDGAERRSPEAEPSRARLARTVFAVGDEKQSIYSFQGAAPELLARIGARFQERAQAAGRGFRRAGLATSFRSAPEILEFVDRVFAPEEARAGLTFGGGPVAHLAHRRGAPGRVDLWPLVTAQGESETPPWDAPMDAPAPDDPKARLARLVAETIHGWIGTEPLPARGRTMRAGDVLVLVRSRGALSTGVIKRLKQLGAPVAGEDRLSLTAQIAVKDLIAFGRFCLFPDDDLTLAAVLRSPLCAVSEASLFDLAHPRRGGLWRALLARRAERADWSDAADLLEDAGRRADFLRPFELYAHILGPRRARARLIARLGPEAEDPIDEFLAEALRYESGGGVTLQGFIDRIERRAVDVKREVEQGRDEVRVMTAHGAKGLEAPVVVLPDTMSAASGGRPVRLLDPETPGAPPIWAGSKDTEPPAVAALRDAYAAREAEEHRRLLYVALTRAEDRLLICGAGDRRGSKPPKGCWYALCQAATLGWGESAPSPVPAKDGAPLAGWRLAAETSTAVDGSAPPAGFAPTPPEWIARPAPRETEPSDLTPSRLGGARDPEAARAGALIGALDQPRGDRDGAATDPDSGRRRGVLIHLLLETLADRPSETRALLAGRLLERAPEAVGFDASKRAEMIAEALQVLDAPEFASLFGPGSHAEVPVSARLEALGPEDRTGPLHGVIDRLVVTPERVVIVDFKTGAAPPSPPEAYLRQLAAYHAALTPMFPDRAVEAALLWTATPRLDMVPTRDLTEALARARAELAGRGGRGETGRTAADGVASHLRDDGDVDGILRGS